MKKLIFIIILFLIFFLKINVNALTNQEKIYMVPYTSSGVNVFAKDMTYKSLDYNGWIIKSTANDYIYYCIDPATHMPLFDESISNNYRQIINDNDITNMLKIDNNLLNRVKLLAYYGYGYKDDKYNHTDHKWYGITQVLIWRTIRPNITWTFKTSRYGNINSGLYLKEISELLTLVYNHSILPSFNEQNIEIMVGDKMTLTDTNNVLYKFNLPYNENVSLEKENNNLIITGLNKTKENILLNRQKIKNDFYLLNSSNVQDVIVRGNINNYNISNINITVHEGLLKIKKVDNDTKKFNNDLIGSIISLYDINNNFIKDIEITKEEENIYLDYGNYYLIEKNPTYKYELNSNKYYFELTREKNISEITIENNKIKGTIVINKLYGGSGYDYVSEKGAEFNIYDNNNNLIDTLKTDSNGMIKKTLEYGTYKIVQIKGKYNYLFSEPFEVNINESKEYVFNLKNIKKSTLIIKKIDKETKSNLSNSTILIYDKNDNLLYEEVTNEEGIIKIENIDVGNYYFIEKESPKYYKLDSNRHYFKISEYGKVYDFYLENERIIGNLEIIKKDENNNLLKGATIGIFDLNNNLIYKDVSNEDGKITINNIKAGKYYLEELKAPYGYIRNKDKISFEIENSDFLKIDVINKKVEMPNTSKENDINYLIGILSFVVIRLIIKIYEKKNVNN